MWRTAALSRAPVHALGRALLQAPGRAILQALGRARHPPVRARLHPLLLFPRFRESLMIASVEAPVGISYLRLHDLFIYMFESEQHRSCFGKYLVSSFWLVFCLLRKTCESFRRLRSYYSRESVAVQVCLHERIDSRDNGTCWSCCGIVLLRHENGDQDGGTLNGHFWKMAGSVKRNLA